MVQVEWAAETLPAEQLKTLAGELARTGVLQMLFARSSGGDPVPWRVLEPWLKSRAVTVAVVDAELGGGALDAALCCDLVYLRRGVVLDLGAPEAAPSAGLVWACGRAGRAALGRLLLEGGTISAERARTLGLAHAVLEADEEIPLPELHSLEALTTARDLARCSSSDSSRALELAAFRLLFAGGHPREGASAFLEGREPRFPR